MFVNTSQIPHEETDMEEGEDTLIDTTFETVPPVSLADYSIPRYMYKYLNNHLNLYLMIYSFFAFIMLSMRAIFFPFYI